MNAAIAWILKGSSERLAPRAYLVLLLLALVLFLPGQCSIPAVDRDEARFAQATRQMIASGNFVDIRFGEETRHVQPVGIYWFQVMTTLPFGGAEAPIWATRLPSLLAAIFGVLITAWFAARLAGASCGLAAGALLAMTLLLNYEANIAKIDAALMLATLVGQVALFEILVRQKAPGKFIAWPAVFWAALGTGVLLKGPIILIPLVGTIVVFALLRRDYRMLLRLRPLLGLPLAFAVFLPWLIAITIETNGAFLSEAVGHSFAGKIARNDDSHGAPPGYHLAFLTLTFFPGMVLLGLAAVHAFTERRTAEVQFLLAWIVPTWVVFEIVVTKLPHYTLPVFPALAILAALGLQEADTHLRAPRGRWVHRLAAGLFALAALAITALPVVAMRELDEPVGPLAVAATLAGLAVLLAGLFLALRPSLPRLAPLALAFAAYAGLMFEGVIPQADKLFPSAVVAERARALTGCEKVAVATAGYREPSNIYHFGAGTLLNDGPQAAAALAGAPACSLAVVDKSQRAAFLSAAAAAGLEPVSLGRVTGRNISNGRDLELDMFVARETRLRPSQQGEAR